MGAVKPFLKWAGGKYKFASQIAAHINVGRQATYFEPFLGGASVFLKVDPHSAVLSDENAALIDCYKAVRAHPRAVFNALQKLALQHSQAHYYAVRDEFNTATSESIQQAARFIYLNKAGFNGIYRVNQKGYYNVPSGNREHLALPSLAELIDTANRLQSASLIRADFEIALGLANAGDVVYLDPPYPPLNDTSFFTHYTADRFSNEEQTRVAKVAHDLYARGCNTIVSNVDTPEVRNMYRGWTMYSIELRRWITAAQTKHFVKELIVVSPAHATNHSKKAAR